MKLDLRIVIIVIVIYGVLTKTIQVRSASILDKEGNNDFLSTNTIEAAAIESNQNNNIDEDLLDREKYAKKMISYMNQSMDPCDDFYEYACGNWKNTLEKRHSVTNRGNLKDMRLELADLTEELIKNPDENSEVKYADEIRQVRMFYESCLQADLFPLQKSKEYLEVIENITGFPALNENWQADNFDWFNATAHLYTYGVESFVKEEIFPMHPFLPFFKLPDIGFDINVHSDNIKTNTTQGYILNEQRMRKYLTTYGVVEPKVTEVIHSIFKFWHAILSVRDEFKSDDDMCNALGKIKYSVGRNDWKKWENYFEIVWNGIYDEELSDCPCAYFYKKLDEIGKEHKEAAANYLSMAFLYRMDARLKDNEVKKDYCNQKVFESFKFLIDQLYVSHMDFNNERHEVGLITEQIRSIFREKLKNLHWLDNKTREEALRKESSITLQVGRIESADLMDQLIKEIRKLQFENLNFEKNNLEIVKFSAYMRRYHGLNHKNLDEETIPQEILTSMQVQGWYYVLTNSIYVMPGIFNPPAYHESWPLSLKYGTLGYAIGHELTHGFDTTGASIDSNGIPRKWYTSKSFEIFENLTKCYIDKFNEYEIAEIQRKIDGNKTKDENIADHGGLRYAFKAYQRHINELREEHDLTNSTLSKLDKMPGLDLTPEQLFYLGFSQLWCADYKEEHIWQELEDEHTNNKYRVLGALSNTVEFAEAYKCPVGSKMNPTESDKKCKLW